LRISRFNLFFYIEHMSFICQFVYDNCSMHWMRPIEFTIRRECAALEERSCLIVELNANRYLMSTQHCLAEISRINTVGEPSRKHLKATQVKKRSMEKNIKFASLINLLANSKNGKSTISCLLSHVQYRI